ncbi:MAG TPA: hypothetical protein VMJ10_10220 [Kofleriaceae bacterium]|nr:hypothetical protein [Kofleriaceae bacterium]
MVRAFALGLGLAVCARVAHAQAPAHDKAGGQKAYIDGQALYNGGDYRGAAEKFKLAYDRDPDPVYLFNLAQADRFAKQCSESADAYRRFLAAAPTAPNRDKVEHYIEEMDACAKDQALTPPSPAPAPAPAPAAAEPNPPQPVIAVRRKNDLDSEPSASPRRLHDHRTAIYMLAGAGMTELIVGAYFTYDLIDANNAQSSCTSAHAIPPCDGKTYSDLDDRGARDNWAVPIAFGLAVATLGTATWLYLHDRAAAEHSLAVAPTRGGAFVSTEWRF